MTVNWQLRLITAATLLVAIGIAALGCSKTPPESKPTSQAFAQRAVSITPQQLPTSNNLDDPATDGWDTEVFHQQAKQQLKSLGRILAHPSHLKPTALEGVFADTFLTAGLNLRSPDWVARVDGLEINQWSSIPETTAEPSLPMTLLRDLVAPFRPGAELRVEFKVFGVERGNDMTHTRQLLSILGPTNTGMTERLVTLKIGWQQPFSNSAPRIGTIVTESVRDALLLQSGEAMLADYTPWALGESVANHQLGLNQWKQRIEADILNDIMGHQGLAIGDADGDGLEDIYVCQTGGIPNRLYRATGSGQVVDIAAAAGVNWLDQTTSALFADLDNDADQDLVLATDSSVVILENDGLGKFERAAEFPDAFHMYSPTAADYDLDGDLDLYLCGYFRPGSSSQDFPYPNAFQDATNGGPNLLLRNDGGLVFVDATLKAGMGEDNSQYSYAASWEDFDNDGDPDLYVANDFGPNKLYVNDNGTFVDRTDTLAAEDGNLGMSVSWGDYNRDGWMDLYISNMFSGAGNRIVPQANFKPGADEAVRKRFLTLARGNSLLANQQGRSFKDVSVAADVTFGRWAWCSSFTDLNNDGWEDLLVANGYITGTNTGDL